MTYDTIDLDYKNGQWYNWVKTLHLFYVFINRPCICGQGNREIPLLWVRGGRVSTRMAYINKYWSCYIDAMIALMA